MSYKIERADVERVIEQINEEYDPGSGEEITPRWDYSGRGMFGDQCFGIVGSTRDLARFLLRVVPVLEDEEDVPTDIWEDVRQDNMGLQTIFYWPGISAE